MKACGHQVEHYSKLVKSPQCCALNPAEVGNVSNGDGTLYRRSHAANQASAYSHSAWAGHDRAPRRRSPYRFISGVDKTTLDTRLALYLFTQSRRVAILTLS